MIMGCRAASCLRRRLSSVRNVSLRFHAAMPTAAITPSAADSVAVAQPA